VRRRTLGIAGRAISTMIAASGYNDIERIYNTTQDDDVAYNLAYIGSDFTEELPAPFDPGYMLDLFNYGFQRARHGYNWTKQPPREWIGSVGEVTCMTRYWPNQSRRDSSMRFALVCLTIGSGLLRRAA
jgi:hypothetical protein